jgi:hypothetical protein
LFSTGKQLSADMNRSACGPVAVPATRAH